MNTYSVWQRHTIPKLEPSQDQEQKGRSVRPSVKSAKINDRHLNAGASTKKKIQRATDEDSSNEENKLASRNGQARDPISLVALVKACARKKDLKKGSLLHASILKQGLIQTNVYVGSSIVDMYAKCGAIAKAQEVFDELPVRDVVSWTTLIAGYTQRGYCKEAVDSFEMMQLEGLSPNGITFASVLKACGNIGALDKGLMLHAETSRQGLLDKDTVLGTALVDMYSKCGALEKAREVFDELPVHNLISWTALILGYTQYGRAEEAIKCFDQMTQAGVSPDAFTFACILKACGSISAADKGHKIHAQIARQGFLMEDVVVGTALVDMYAKCGALNKAKEVFDELPRQSTVSWTALLTGYAQNGQGEEAIRCFEKMQHDGLAPDPVTFACILNACGDFGALSKGQDIHDKVFAERLLESSSLVGNALVDLYAKCGDLLSAQEVFDELPLQDLVSWNSLMAGYSQYGKDAIVFELFDIMKLKGIKPDEVTLAIVLNTCTHSGVLVKGELYFKTLITVCGIKPIQDHHICTVDLFGRTGLLDKALAVIKKMPYPADSPMWRAILGACQKWGELNFGRLAFEHAVRLDEDDGAAYVCTSNICAAAGFEDDEYERYESGKFNVGAS